MAYPMLVAAVFAQAPAAAPASPERGGLDGAWTVDLSVEPGKPYVKPMRLALAADGSVTGDFYDSDILAGRWKQQNGRLCLSFRTTDGAGPYHTAACQAGDRIEGQTWAEHRNFVFVWSATRGAPKP